MTTLKSIFRFIASAIMTTLILFSCSKEDRNGTNEDSADRFVGTYAISITEYVVWGNDSGTLNDTGVLTITKTSEDKVSASGFMINTGTVANSAIYFESIRASDSAGYMTTTFGPATLNGNVLTMTATSTGKLGKNGVLYPFRSTQQITGIRQ